MDESLYGYNQEEYLDPTTLMALQNLNNPLNFPSKPKKDEKLGVFEIDFKPIIEDWIHSLRGYHYNPKEKQWELNEIYKNKVIKPPINEVGISDLYNLFYNYFHKGIPIGRIMDESERNLILRNFLCALADLLFFNHELYEITNESYIYGIFSSLENNLLITLNRAVGGWEANNRIQSIQVQQSQISQDSLNRRGGVRGFLGNLFGGNR